VNGAGAIDDVVVTFVRSGADSCAEICTHGGVQVVQEVLSLLKTHGVRIVEAGELEHSLRAADPVQREVDLALMHAGSRRMADWLLSQREILPAGIEIARGFSAAERAAFISRSRVAILLLRGFSIAIVGPPNAGKSTLANRLIGSERLITSDEPGTTRDWVSATVIIRGWPVTLTDTAGVRGTDCTIESEAIRRGIEQAARADLALVVLDATARQAERKDLLARLEGALPVNLGRMVVLNKCDLAAGAGSANDDPPAYHVSALIGTGIDELEAAIELKLGLNQLDPARPTAISESQLQRVMISPGRQSTAF
jgi:small GTP-binding protein